MTQWIKQPWSRVVVFGAVVALGAGTAITACSSSGDDTTTNPDTGVVDTDTGSGTDTNPATDSGTDTNKADTTPPPDTAPPPDTGCAAFDAHGIDAVTADAGAQLVNFNGCKGCHTADLSGSTSAIKGAFPKNLTSDSKTGIACVSNADLMKVITTGVGPDGSTFCVMPKFTDGTIKTDGDGGVGMDGGIQAIIDYLRTLPAVSKDIPATVCTDGGTDSGDAATDGG